MRARFRIAWQRSILIALLCLLTTVAGDDEAKGTFAAAAMAAEVDACSAPEQGNQLSLLQLGGMLKPKVARDGPARRGFGRMDLRADEEPTMKGAPIIDFFLSQQWIVDLFTNSTKAEAACQERAPSVLLAIGFARQQNSSSMAQVAACSAIIADVALAGAEMIQPYLAAAGGIEVATEAMRSFPQHKILQRTCAEALGSLSLYQYDVMQAAGKAGAVELVLDAQRRWPKDPSMQIGGVSGCFHDLSWDNRLRWQKAGGIDYNMQTIRDHFNDSGVVEQCWFAFSSGTQSPNEQRFVEAGGIELGIESIKAHGLDRRIREETMQAMRAIMIAKEEYRQRLADAGYIEELTRAMREVPMDIHTQSPACANIAIIAEGDPKRAERAIASGGIELAVKAIRDFPDMVSSVNWAYDAQYTVVADCLAALAIMSLQAARAGLERLRSIFHAKDVIQMAVDSRGSGSPRVREYGYLLLTQLDQPGLPANTGNLSKFVAGNH